MQRGKSKWKTNSVTSPKQYICLMLTPTVHSSSHIPFRDSKLTRILQPSLSGNARVSVICTVSPVLSSIEESVNTLKFAERVKLVVTSAKANEVTNQIETTLPAVAAVLMEPHLDTWWKGITATIPNRNINLKSQVRSWEWYVGSTAKGFREHYASWKAKGLSYIHRVGWFILKCSVTYHAHRLQHEEQMRDMDLVRTALKERYEYF